MKSLLVALLAAVVLALVWGVTVDSEAVPSRSGLKTAQVGADWSATLPVEPAAATAAYLERVPPEIRARGDAFGITRYLALALRLATLVASVALVMSSGAAARVRDIIGSKVRRLWLQDALCALCFLAALFAFGLPVETYAGFVRPRDAGFSQRSYFDWLGEAVLGWAVISAFYVVGITLGMALIRRRPRSWAGWATLVYLALSCVYVLISPQYIEPLFNSISPLADGPQKQAILSLARANGVPANDVFVRDASRQSDLLNAHVSGIGGTARIILDDNTISKTPKPEFELVMAHELGHYVLAHIPKAIVFDSLITGIGFVLIGWTARRLFARYGQRWRVTNLADSGAIPILWGSVLLWGFISLPIANSISREQEAEADIFGINASRQPLGLADFMLRDADAANLDPSPIEEWLFYDHPSARRRIETAMRWRAEHPVVAAH